MKKQTRSRKWRHVYPYICLGCNKKRIAFVFERAQAGMCTRCQADQVPEGQTPLFEITTTA